MIKSLKLVKCIAFLLTVNITLQHTFYLRTLRAQNWDPKDAVKCGIQHNGQFYLDKFLVFGAVNGMMIFERISDAIRYMLGKQKVQVWNYIDDTFAAVEAEGAMGKFHTVYDTNASPIDRF